MAVVTSPATQAVALTAVIAVAARTVPVSFTRHRKYIQDVTTQHINPPRFLRLRAYVWAVVTSTLRKLLPGMFKPRTVGVPFRMEYQSAAAEVTGVAVVRGNLCSGGTREALIAIKRDKRFGVNRHSNGAFAGRRAGVSRPKEGSTVGHTVAGVKSCGRCDCV